MGHFTIHNYQNMEYTLLANSFIDNFMFEANDVQIKVYLYLLRHVNNPQGCSILAIMNFFNYSEKDIMHALSFWERKKLLCLTFDDNHELTGLSFCAIPSLQSENNTTMNSNPNSLESKTPSESPAIIKTVTYLSNSSTYVKPEYTLDQLAEFQNRESTSELMFIAESYLGRTLSANDVRSIFFISDELHFSFDLLDYLLQYCVDRGKKDFRYIEKVAISWAQANVTTVDQAQNQITKYDKDTYAVMNALGKNNQPTPKEIEFIRRWFQVYGFTSDIILEACERTVLATDKHRFEYADKILSSWKSFGIRHKGDIEKADAAFASKKKKNTSGSTNSKNKFNDFQQNDYDFDSLEKELLSN